MKALSSSSSLSRPISTQPSNCVMTSYAWFFVIEVHTFASSDGSARTLSASTLTNAVSTA
jgi:hypothetical protein